MQNVLISGITGQIGSYLAEDFLKDNYKVYGIIRKSSSFNTGRINHIYGEDNLKLFYGDLTDSSSLMAIINETKPDIFINMAAQSHVRVSFDMPEYTNNVTGQGVARCLEILRKISPKTRFYQASSSEMFGASPPPQNESTPFHPNSPYAVAKLAGYWATVNYREAYNMFCSNGIVFNTESERRGETFVTRKITRAAARIFYDLQKELVLGNLDAKRDWSYAKDTSKAIKLIVEHSSPDDFVIATGESHSVREFAEETFNLLKLDPYKYIRFDRKYLRPLEVDHLQGDASKAKKILNWQPTVSFKELVKKMLEHDLAEARNEYIITTEPKSESFF